uniref:Transmembrane protein 150B n=1 Tax=Rhinopithecus bieti TaxID=61621 RepID=A0A2K6MN87_RHIBE
MWGYLSLMPIFLAVWAISGVWIEKNQRPTHLAGAFLAFILGNVYFWLQLLLWRLKSLPQPGAPWIGPLRLGLCSFCTILIVAMIVLHACSLRSVSAACEWAVAMLLFALFGLFAVDFSALESCTLCVQPWPSLSPSPASPISLPVQL